MSFLRLCFLLLVLANLLMYAWGQGYWGGGEDGREPQRLDEQKAAELLRIVPSGDGAQTAPALSAVAPAAALSATAAAPATVADVGKPAALVAPAPTAASCRLLSGFKLADARQWVAANGAKMADLKFSVVPGEAPASYDVLIAALLGKEGAEAKLKEVKALGVATPVRTVPDGPEKFALVFATLPSETEARSLLQELMGKGVKTARVVARIPPTAPAQVEVRAADGGKVKDLKELLAGRSDIHSGDCLPR